MQEIDLGPGENLNIIEENYCNLYYIVSGSIKVEI
jgi:hypothetical protein